MTSEVLTVPTAFGDLSELSEGLADRVDEERIILYGPEPFGEGETVGFSVLLMDGTEALTGVGRVAAAVDGGEDRAPETRFDIVFDSLQLDGRSEVVYERIVLARQSLYGADPATGEVSLADLEAAEEVAPVDPEPAEDPDLGAAYAVDDVADAVGAEPEDDATAAPDDYAPAEDYAVAAEEYAVPADAELGGYVAEDAVAEEAPVGEEEVFASFPPPADEPGVWEEEQAASDEELDAVFDEPEAFSEGATMVGSVESLRPPTVAAPSGAPAPSLPDAPSGFQLQAPPGGVLTRPMAPATWWPEAVPAQPRPSTGHFQYGDTLPTPNAPPRPNLDSSLRVSPAPRPGDALQPAAPPSLYPGNEATPPATEAVALDDALDVAEPSDDVDAFLEAGANDDLADANGTYEISSEAPDAYELTSDVPDEFDLEPNGSFEDLEAETQHAVELPEDDR